jgi:CheY-like chemotaxis protein
MVSSFTQESIKEKARNVGIDLFLNKPINPSYLHDMLGAIFLDNQIISTYTRQTKVIPLKDKLETLASSTILLVEDNKTNQDIIIGLLQNSGIDIDIANNGEEAVEKYKRYQDKYELILMDLQMPIMDGIEATRHIREMSEDIPIIALTANAMKSDIDKTREAKMNEHLNKPIEVDKLYETLLRYIEIKDNSLELIEEYDDELDLRDLELKSIDIQKGMSTLQSNKLFLRYINGFYNEYKELNIDSLDKDELIRVVHTIKGLSAGFGANKLHSIAKDIEDNHNFSALDEFHIELYKVLEELKEIIEYTTKDEEIIQRDNIDSSLRDELIEDLKKVIKKRNSKDSLVIIERLKEYELKKEDKEMIEEIEGLVKRRKYKDAIGLLDEK